MDRNMAKYILDSLDFIDEKPQNQQHLSLIALQLQAAARDNIKSLEEVRAEIKIIVSPEVDNKIRELRVHEYESDLCWIDYSSWNFLPEKMQKAMLALLDPLNWSGFYFQYSKLVQHEHEIFSLLDSSCSLIFLSDMKNYHMMSFSSEKSYVDGMGIKKFADFKKSIDHRIIRSVGATDDGYKTRRFGDGKVIEDYTAKRTIQGYRCEEHTRDQQGAIDKLRISSIHEEGGCVRNLIHKV